MKKFSAHMALFVLISTLLIVPCCAQGQLLKFRSTKKTESSSSKFTPRQISHQLQQRVKYTYQRAKKTQEACNGLLSPFYKISRPVRHALHSKYMPQTRIYPDKPFLTTRQQIADYMLAQSNRLFIRDVERLQVLKDQLNEQLPLLEETAKQTPQPQDPLPWLVQQIPAQTSLLHIGEGLHGFVEIRSAVQQLLVELRQQNPFREIILFTEFLPADFHWNFTVPPSSLDFPILESIWKTALRNQIEVIGLEPDFVMKDSAEAMFLSREGKKIRFSQWGHLEGVHLRNVAWAKVLQAYRAKHPDALFVVYSGAGHILYNYPFALPKNLPNEKHFVISLCPDKILNFKRSGRLSFREIPTDFEDLLETLTQNSTFAQPVLQFTAPLSDLTGFNIRIKLPINLELYAR